MIASDAAERRQIIQRQMLGMTETPREADVIRNIAANLSRFQKRRLATEMRRHESAQRSTGQPEREAARKQTADVANAERLKTAIAHSPIKLLTGPDAGAASGKASCDRRRGQAPKASPEPARLMLLLRSAKLCAPAGSGCAEPEMDGKWHRVEVEGDRGRKMSGRYRGYLDGRPAGFIENYRAAWRSHGGLIVPCRR